MRISAIEELWDRWAHQSAERSYSRNQAMVYKASQPMDSGDLEWLQAVAHDPKHLDTMLSVGRTQRILNSLDQLEAKIARLSARGIEDMQDTIKDLEAQIKIAYEDGWNDGRNTTSVFGDPECDWNESETKKALGEN
jgi:hypothetical protein